MITVADNPHEDTLEFTFSGQISAQDYQSVLIPALDAAIERTQRIRLLAFINSGLSDFSAGAMWQDARTGIGHWSGFERAAIVTDESAIAYGVKAFSLCMPCPVRVFARAEEDEARRWLQESLGSIHQQALGENVWQIRLLGELDASAYEQASRQLDDFLHKQKSFRLLLDLREFAGWQDMSGLYGHFRLVRSHVDQLERAAIIGDKTWEKMAVSVGKRLFGKQAHYFPAEDVDAARQWIQD